MINSSEGLWSFLELTAKILCECLLKNEVFSSFHERVLNIIISCV